MSVSHPESLQQARDKTGILQRITTMFETCWQANAPITVLGVVMTGFTLAALVGLLSDPRIIAGQPAWLKPFKFGVSIATYAFSIAWVLGFVQTRKPWIRKALRIFTWIVIGVVVAEIVPITIQVIRGTRSHFNVETPFDSFLLGIMAVSITVLWIANLVLVAILLWQRFEDRAFGWSLRLGLIITIIGMATGYLMTLPTAEQIASWEQGAPVTIIGAHSVGVQDGGPGMPITGWSTEGGDLRIPHFVGLHALQVIPFAGGWISRRRRLTSGQRLSLVWTVSLGYLGLVVLVTWQALRGQPLIAPDALTVGAFAGLLAATLLATVWTLSPHGRRVLQRHATGR